MPPSGESLHIVNTRGEISEDVVAVGTLEGGETVPEEANVAEDEDLAIGLRDTIVTTDQSLQEDLDRESLIIERETEYVTP